jgi:hypothetical protein
MTLSKTTIKKTRRGRKRRKGRGKKRFKFKINKSVSALNAGYSDGYAGKAQNSGFKAGSPKDKQYLTGYGAGQRAKAAIEWQRKV